MNKNEHIKAIQEYLGTPQEQRDIHHGATLLLQHNRNKMLFQSIIKRSYHKKLDYELGKILTEAGSQQTLPKNKGNGRTFNFKILATKGIRPDHQAMPPEIAILFSEACDMQATLRSLHEKLKNLTEIEAPKEHIEKTVKEIIATEDKALYNFKIYDSWTPGGQEDKKIKAKKIMDLQKTVNSAIKSHKAIDCASPEAKELIAVVIGAAKALADMGVETSKAAKTWIEKCTSEN